MAAAGHSPASDSSESVPAVQVYWTPNLGCHSRVSLTTGVPENGAYVKSASWVTRRVLRTVGDGGVVIYPQAGNRVFPRDAPVASLKLKPEDVPRHLGQQHVTAYFPHGETAVTRILEGQLAFLQHVHLYDSTRRTTEEYTSCNLGCCGSTNSSAASWAASPAGPWKN